MLGNLDRCDSSPFIRAGNGWEDGDLASREILSLFFYLEALAVLRSKMSEFILYFILFLISDSFLQASPLKLSSAIP